MFLSLILSIREILSNALADKIQRRGIRFHFSLGSPREFQDSRRQFVDSCLSLC
jgi:hypothetical protein